MLDLSFRTFGAALISTRNMTRLAAAVVLAILASGNSAQAAKFLGLGKLPNAATYSFGNAVSANGSVVVGFGRNQNGDLEAYRWRSNTGMVGLGDLPGGPFVSGAAAVSADGFAIVGSGTSTSGVEAFLIPSAGSAMMGFGDFAGGVFHSYASDISADGTAVVGLGTSSIAGTAFRWTSGSGMIGLGDLSGGAIRSEARAISADGAVIVGDSESASGNEAFRWTTSGGMVGLGDLPGGVFRSLAYDVSADGSVIVGRSFTDSGGRPFRWTSDTGMVELGDLPGEFPLSTAYGVSADGSVIVGTSDSTGGIRAFIWDAGNGTRALQDVLSPNVGTAIGGWTLIEARGISADGRTVVGTGINPEGNREAWLAYLADEIYWFPSTSGAWDSSLSWSGPFMPGAADTVVIDPTSALTVTGPTTHKTVNSLVIGGSGIGRVTLRLAGTTSGDLNVATYAYLHPNAEVILADGRLLSVGATLFNSGVVRGTGTVNTNLVNYAGGEVRVAAGEAFVVSGGGHTNEGKLEAIGGSLEFIGAMTNSADTGLVTGRNAILRFQGGLTNDGALALTGGTNDVYGDIANNAGATIIVSGGASATFVDDITQNGTFRVSKVGTTTSSAVILGDFSGSGGSTGGGDIFIEGDVQPGNSPASVSYQNNIGLGLAAVVNIEIGGVVPGTEYDQMLVTGALALDGALKVSLIGGFMPSAGQSFDILDWESRSGEFSFLHLPPMAGGLTWDTTRLYVDGTLAIVAPPALPGDYNNNGAVDAADYVLWRKHNGTSTTLPNDTTSGSVGSGDYGIWRAHFGESAGTGSVDSAVIPEPASCALLLLTSSIASASRRLRCLRVVQLSGDAGRLARKKRRKNK